MTASAELVPAVGGTRLVPAPDPIAADYLLLALRLDQHIPGLVDGYFGPADLKARVDMEQRRPPAVLRADVGALAERVTTEVDDPDRRAWLTAQLAALDAHARVLDGDPLGYLDHVERCLGFRPIRHEDALFDAAAAEIDAVLPGAGPLHERLAAWDRELEVPVDRLLAVVGWLVERFRARSAVHFGLPVGEDLRVGLVRGQPWTAYNWYDGGRRSRIDINTDLPMTASYLLVTVAHETFPGHHLEQAWQEADLVDGQGRLEGSVLLLNTPESTLSEGLAEYGTSIAAPSDERAGLLVELFERAGLPIAADPARALDVATRAVAIARAREVLGASRETAALLRHADGATHEVVLDYLRDVGRFEPAVAAKRLEFIEHPLWRAYIFVYHDGEALVRRWVEVAPEADRIDRFGRLLHERLTPGRLLAELG